MTTTIVVLALAAALVVEMHTAGVSSAEGGHRHLVLITLDTFRADYLSSTGSKKVDTPHLDRLASAGVLFNRARTPVPLTLPAHASILTGSYPPAHGVRDMGAYRLPSTEVTLAERLKEYGYHTAAFLGAFVLDRRFGLAQGFDVYDDRVSLDVADLENIEAERKADAVFAAFRGWLQVQEGKAPFFAWIHLYDPHAPYEPPEPYRSRYPDDPYAGEVAYTDEVVGKIVGELEAKGFLESTLVAVVGDHGEGLGEHQEATHSLLIYNSTLHVPMVLFGRRIVPAGKKVRELTRTIDLAPTVLDYLGLPHRLGEGKSLRSLIETGQATEEIVAYSESLYPRLHLGWSELRGVESGDYRFILAPRPELYHLGQDPGETKNRIDDLPEVAEGLRSLLAPLMETVDAGKAHAPEILDPQTEAMLRTLGYAASAVAPEGKSVVDPKDKMAIWNQVHYALFYFSRKDYPRAAEILREILTSEKDIPMAYEYLGSCLMRLEAWAEAEKVYRKAIARGIRSPEFHVNLGQILSQRGELSRAESELRAALALDPLNVTAYQRLGDVYRAGKKDDLAIEHYRRAIDLNPHYVYAWSGMGMSLARQGRNGEALEALQKVVNLDPSLAPGHFNLAVQLERMNRAEDALAAYRTFMSLSTDKTFPKERGIASSAIARLEGRPY